MNERKLALITTESVCYKEVDEIDKQIKTKDTELCIWVNTKQRTSLDLIL
jgi:hypothetical protein